jgi:hypothetical protein
VKPARRSLLVLVAVAEHAATTATPMASIHTDAAPSAPAFPRGRVCRQQDPDERDDHDPGRGGLRERRQVAVEQRPQWEGEHEAGDEQRLDNGERPGVQGKAM